MRNLLICIALILSANSYSAEIDTIKVSSKITEVTVYFSGAQVTRQADLKLKKGKHMVVLNKLTHQVDAQSIQVLSIADCKTLSVKHQPEKRSDGKKDKDEQAIEDAIRATEDKILELKNRASVYDLEEKMILQNSDNSKKEAVSSIADLKAAADFYRQRINEIRAARMTINSEIEDANEVIKEHYAELNKLRLENQKAYSEVMVALDCDKDISTKLTFSYYTESAAWTPLYDFRVNDITKPLTIVYNANVYQSSGEDWKNVKVKLSTTNPSLTGQVPELPIWYVDRTYTPVISKPTIGSGTLRGKVLDSETQEPIPFVNVVLEKNGAQVGNTSTDFDGLYSIKQLSPGSYQLKASYVGFKPSMINGLIIRADQITFQDISLKSTMVELTEFQVMDYKVPLIDKDKTSMGATITSEEISGMPARNDGGRPARNVGGTITSNFTPQQREITTTNFLSNNLKTNVTNLEYEIDIPYTIPSDGEDYSLKIKEVNLPVKYIYHVVPKLESDAFLMAEIEDWSELNLLTGKSNIYYQGTFVGSSEINADKTNDTLSISLGRDNNIKVTREGDKKLYDKRITGSNIREVIGWNITVKNNRTSPVNIMVEDQYPISEKKSIEVERHGAEGAKVNEKTGNIKWTIELPANEKRELKFSYTVKYPRMETLYLE